MNVLPVAENYPNEPPRRKNSRSHRFEWLLALLLIVAMTNIVIYQRHLSMTLSSSTSTSVSSSNGYDLDIDLDNRIDASFSLKIPSTALNKKNELPGQEPRRNTVTELEHSQNEKKTSSTLAGLSCASHGGPPDDVATQEMVYWSDIPSDAKYRSPFYDPDKYVTFEPDHGGWNNIRMSMETVLVLAHAMGRTLVLPPEQGVYLLGKKKGTHKTSFTFNDFFHLDQVADEHEGLQIITMEEFLTRMAITGRLKNLETGQVETPANGQVQWNNQNLGPLWSYLRTVGVTPQGWDPSECVAAIPQSTKAEDEQELEQMMQDLLVGKYGPIPDPEKDLDYVGKPTPVDAPTLDRLKEMLATRKKLCIYNKQLREVPLIHFKQDHSESTRLLTHFYAFVFFQDWRQDLWSKRFIRDHVRYIDEIMCAAARIVSAVRERARRRQPDNAKGEFDSFHVRRGDFQYKSTRIDASQLLDYSKDELKEGSTLYIATDEREKQFFDILTKHYDVTYLDDYMHLIADVNPNYYGMLDQLVASKGRVFFGTWWSTLSGFINRMRGYYIVKHKLEGYENGTMKSYYFIPIEKKFQMVQYRPVKLPIYMREFPVAWRDIDKGIK